MRFEARGLASAPEAFVEKLLASPLLEGGAMLNEAESVLVSIVAGSDLTMSEVNRVMSQINRACENAHIIMGAAVEADFGDRMSVTVIATRRAPPEMVPGRAGAGTDRFPRDQGDLGPVDAKRSPFVTGSRPVEPAG